MIGTLLRVFIGFVLAAVAAGLALVLHADTPAEIMARTNGSVTTDVAMSIGELALKAGTHIAIFAAPFALIVAAFGEWQRARSLWFYLVAGLAIAAGGFMAQHASEAAGQQTVLNDYAMRAFGIAGLAAGLVYWLVAGRCAGGSDVRSGSDLPASKAPEAMPKAKPAVTTETSPRQSAAERAQPSAAPAVKPAPSAAAAATAAKTPPVAAAEAVKPAGKPAAGVAAAPDPAKADKTSAAKAAAADVDAATEAAKKP